MKTSFLSFLFLLLFSIGYSQQTDIEKKKILHGMDSLHISFKRPITPRGYIGYRNCDSIPFFKKVSGDTITILRKGGFAPPEYDSQYEWNSFIHWATHPDTTNGSYLSRHTDMYGKDYIIIQNNSIFTFLFQHDSLFEWYSDDLEYQGLAFQYGMDFYFGQMDSMDMVKKTEQARKKYKPIQRKNLLFTKAMFNETNVVTVNKKLHHEGPKITLRRRWIKNGLECYDIEVATPTDLGMDSKFDYIFDEKMNFVEWENCDH